MAVPTSEVASYIDGWVIVHYGSNLNTANIGQAQSTADSRKKIAFFAVVAILLSSFASPPYFFSFCCVFGCLV